VTSALQSRDVAPVPAGAEVTKGRQKTPEDLGLGQNPDGRIEIAARVVEKIAARAAIEVDDAGGAGARMLGRSVPGAGRLGIRGAGLDELPTVTAEVDGQLVFIDLELAVRWPAPVLKVADAVRQRVIDRIEELVGLQVREVNIEIAELVSRRALPRVS
jgi:uncharacterized alkaline shock family protein YloU